MIYKIIPICKMAYYVISKSLAKLIEKNKRR